MSIFVNNINFVCSSFRRELWIVLLLYLLLISACVAHVGGPAIWEDNTLKQGVNLYYADVHEAVLEALQVNALPVQEDRQLSETFPELWITRTRLSGELVTIEIESLKVSKVGGSPHDLRPQAVKELDYLTGISVHVGAGNRKISEEILKWINTQLIKIGPRQ